MKLIGIYKILNKLNGKFYIGSSTDLKQRWRNHKFYLLKNIHQNVYLQASWNKNGENAFEFEIVEIVDDKLKLVEREQWWIDKTQCYNKNIGYNQRLIAEVNFGVKQSKETIEKRVKSLTGQKRSEEVKLKLSRLAKGRKHTEETKMRMRGRKQTLETKAKFIKAMTGRKHTVEHNLKISEAGKNRRHSEETKIKLSLIKKGNINGRNKNKWPHELGCRCKCEECYIKRRDSLNCRRKGYYFARVEANANAA